MTMTAPRPAELRAPRRRLVAVTTRRTSGQPALTPAMRPPDPPADPVHSTGIVLSSTMTMLAIVCLWVAGQMLWFGAISESRDQQLLYGEFRTQLASATAPVGPVVPVGDPVALLTVPTLGLQQVVVEGTASGDLLAGPGHLRDTPLPGQEGTSVVFGRAATYGAPFGRLTELRKGDQISVVMGQGRVVFQVLDVRRAGDPLPQPPAAGHARLTLVTAEGSGRFGGVAASSAVYVDADSQKSFPAPAGRPTAVPASENVLAADRGALPMLVLCLGLLLALTLATVAARQRWSVARVWVVSCAPAIALAWLTTDVVMRLLPNLM
jgi:sortase A